MHCFDAKPVEVRGFTVRYLFYGTVNGDMFFFDLTPFTSLFPFFICLDLNPYFE